MSELTIEQKRAIAKQMRELDDETRAKAISDAENVIDRRGMFTRIQRNREIAESYRFARKPEGAPAA